MLTATGLNVSTALRDGGCAVCVAVTSVKSFGLHDPGGIKHVKTQSDDSQARFRGGRSFRTMTASLAAASFLLSSWDAAAPGSCF